MGTVGVGTGISEKLSFVPAPVVGEGTGGGGGIPGGIMLLSGDGRDSGTLGSVGIALGVGSVGLAIDVDGIALVDGPGSVGVIVGILPAEE